nr:cytochrome-c peroxidase [Bradyrhizobium shewense]
MAQFWDGRAADLKAQAAGPVQSRVECDARTRAQHIEFND